MTPLPPPDRIQTLILSVLKEAQEMSGREWHGLAADAQPIGALDGFDSLSGVEVTVMVEAQLGCRLDVDSLFVSDDGKRALTLAEVSDRVSKMVGKGGTTT